MVLGNIWTLDVMSSKPALRIWAQQTEKPLKGGSL